MRRGRRKDADPYVRAGRNGDLGTLECLVRLGVGLGPQLLCVAERSGVALPVLRWLVEREAPWDEDAAEAVEKVACAAKENRDYGDSVAWLEARLGREVRGMGSESSSYSDSEWDEASGSGSEEGGSGDGGQVTSASDDGEGGNEGGSASEGEGGGRWGPGGWQRKR